MSPICGCHGCRFEKPQLEARAAAAERKLAALAMAVEREHKPTGHSLNVRDALRAAHDLLDDALAERAA